jgi:hypothetical protein
MNNRRTLIGLAALMLASCSDFMAGYNDAKAHRGEPGYSFPERLARVGDAALQAAGDYAVGYSNASDADECQHPHGTVTAVSTTPGEWPTYTTINY